MTVRVVTDSSSDLPASLARELGITVVPLHVHVGDRTFTEGVDLDAETFYRDILPGPVLPTTSQPSVGAFVDVYTALARETDEIISIHISSKLSGTHQAALLGRERAPKGCRIEVVDSQHLSMALGLQVLLAARAARDGGRLEHVSRLVRDAIPCTHIYAVLDTLEYLRKGGRIGNVKAFLGALLHIKPLLSFRDGAPWPLERARTRARALDRLCELAQGLPRIRDMAVMYNTTPDEAAALADRLATGHSRESIVMARMGPVLGTHVGPGALAVAALTDA
ncbi:MAG: DegV family protein [Dehalococcoidia bacterium]|nr:DegV family protein [Dehalococcoidia bacterium]